LDCSGELVAKVMATPLGGLDGAWGGSRPGAIRQAVALSPDVVEAAAGLWGPGARSFAAGRIAGATPDCPENGESGARRVGNPGARLWGRVVEAWRSTTVERPRHPHRSGRRWRAMQQGKTKKKMGQLEWSSQSKGRMQSVTRTSALQRKNWGGELLIPRATRIGPRGCYVGRRRAGGCEHVGRGSACELRGLEIRTPPRDPAGALRGRGRLKLRKSPQTHDDVSVERAKGTEPLALQRADGRRMQGLERHTAPPERGCS